MSKHYWILTIPQHEYTPYQPEQLEYLRGQLERGTGTRMDGTSSPNQLEQVDRDSGEDPESRNGFLHWQLVVKFKRKVRLGGVRALFGPFHAEPTRSAKAMEYVWKEDTRIPGTQFELGRKPFNRSSATDWALIRTQAQSGSLSPIPPDVYIRCYNQLRRIESDYARPVGMPKTVNCYWGASGTGKSHLAWEQAGPNAYSKDPRTKFWDGYRNEENVVIDEFRGSVDIAHILRWFDKYPVRFEVKGSSRVSSVRNIWITSNLHPKDWYPDLDEETLKALLRRINVTHFTLPFGR